MPLLLRNWRSGGSHAGLGETLGYLGFQTLAAALAVVSSPLYFATHYVEYHVLMYPRCFHTSLDRNTGVDRWFAWLRGNRMAFYGLLLMAAGVVFVCGSPIVQQPARSFRFLAIVSIFDGLFVFHYFVEMLIWKFSDPFFRRTLASLYFAPRRKVS